MTLRESELTLFAAKTVRVPAPNLIEATLSLPFGVSIARTLRLDNVSNEGLGQAERERAMHCLVVLAGGKRLLVQLADVSTHNPVLEARVYLEHRTHGTLVGQTFDLSPTVNPVLELAPFMHWLGTRGFQISDVKRALNGER